METSLNQNPKYKINRVTKLCLEEKKQQKRLYLQVTPKDILAENLR